MLAEAAHGRHVREHQRQRKHILKLERHSDCFADSDKRALADWLAFAAVRIRRGARGGAAAKVVVEALPGLVEARRLALNGGGGAAQADGGDEADARAGGKEAVAVADGFRDKVDADAGDVDAGEAEEKAVLCDERGCRAGWRRHRLLWKK